ncbi:hypothetical protein EVAR_51458_1 [Eumeta japonica]|uniref:Uncharacterized protein n=1 Tax=Eumeta variegata TaxID=151549 RepID=A0A4C1XRG9_EUMVA|nr:hypothetical protein EVAR_51458_1 [Eumeta japonica]
MQTFRFPTGKKECPESQNDYPDTGVLPVAGVRIKNLSPCAPRSRRTQIRFCGPIRPRPARPGETAQHDGFISIYLRVRFSPPLLNTETEIIPPEPAGSSLRQ